MDKFLTPVSVSTDSLSPFNRDQHFVSLGSCFADSIGRKLGDNKWTSLLNPFGTVFHPFAIFDLLKEKDGLKQDLFLEHEERVYHYRLPKVFSAKTRIDFESKWQQEKAKLTAALSKPKSVLILTLGTSLLYSLKNEWVANCHQQPSHLFQKSLTAIESMLASWSGLFAELPSHCQVIVTVSPVRHLKEGLSESSLSKSQLRVLADAMVKSDPLRIRYFPAYEIMMDELRDYRFYARDMLHPSEQAIDHIWDRFLEAYFSQEARQSVATWQKIKARLDHRPINPGTFEHKRFLLALQNDLEAFSDLSIDEERAEVQRRLHAFPFI
jgi:hypothetical protein